MEEKLPLANKHVLADVDKKSKKRHKLISGISLLAILGLFVVVTICVGQPLVAFVSNSENFRDWVKQQGFLGYLTFISIMCLQVVIAIIPGEVIEIGAGYAFGAWQGMLLCLVGAAAGSSIIYGFTKLFGHKLVEAFISREKINSLQFIKNSKKLNLLIFILFFIPGTPKDVITYFIGLTPMRLGNFLIISSIARIPSVITSTLGGNALGLQNYTFAILVFSITAVVSLIGVLIYHKITKHSGEESTNDR